MIYVSELQLVAKGVRFFAKIAKIALCLEAQGQNKVYRPREPFQNTLCTPRNWPAPEAPANFSWHSEYFEMAREDGTPYFGPVPRGTKRFLQFLQKSRTPLATNGKTESLHADPILEA